MGRRVFYGLGAAVVFSLLAGGLSLGAHRARALMPPHVTLVTPSEGRPLLEDGRILKFWGYSLFVEAKVTRLDDQVKVPVEHYLWTVRLCNGRRELCERGAPPGFRGRGGLTCRGGPRRRLEQPLPYRHVINYGACRC